jgi:MFS family permease
MVVYNLVAATIHLRFLRETTATAPAHHAAAGPLVLLKRAYGGIPSTLRQLPRALRALAGVLVLGFVVNGVAGSFWVVYAQEEIGLSSSAWGLVLLVESALRCLMYIPAGWMADHWGRTRCILGALVLGAVAVPSFVYAQTFVQVLLVRVVMAVVAPLFVTASSALMADLVPREMRGRVMAALGRGTVFIGAASGGTGGPGVGFVITIPLMVASFAGGYLYAAAPRLPWYVVGVALVVALLLGALFIRDPETAHS